MPQIREYVSQGRGGNNFAGNQISGGSLDIGGAIANLGQGLSQVAGHLEQKEREQQEFEVNSAAMEEQTNLIQYMDEAKKQANADGSGFFDGVNQELQTRKDKILEGATSEFKRKALDARMSQVYTNVSRDALEYQSQAKGKFEADKAQNIFNQNQNILRTNPKYLDVIAQSEKDFIETNPYWNKTQKQEMVTQRKNALWDSSLDGEVTGYETNPNITVAQVDAKINQLNNPKNGFQENNSKQGYDSSLTRLQKLKEVLGNKEESQKYDGWKEAMAQRRSTGEVSNKDSYTPDWIKANVKDPDKQKMMLYEDEITRAMSDKVKFVKNAPMTDIVNELEKRQTENVEVNTDKFYKERDVSSALMDTLKKRSDAMKNSAVDYTLDNNPTVKASFDQFAKDPNPSTLTDFAEKTLAEQRRLDPTNQPSILPIAEINKVKAVLANVPEGEKGAAQASEYLQNMVSQYGKYAPIIVKDLAKNKAINNVQYVAASAVIDPTQKGFSEELMKAGAKPTKDLIKALPDIPNAENNARTAAKNALAEFSNSFKGMPDQGVAVTSAYIDTITQLILYRSAVGGRDAVGDTDEIANKLIHSRYEFTDGVRIPKTLEGTPIDTSKVEDGIYSVRNNIQDLDITNIPTSATVFTRPEDLKKEYLANIQRTGSFVTKSDDKGVRLIDEQNRQVFHIKNGKKLPVEYTWQELTSDNALSKKKFESSNAFLKVD